MLSTRTSVFENNDIWHVFDYQSLRPQCLNVVVAKLALVVGLVFVVVVVDDVVFVDVVTVVVADCIF